MCLSRSVHPVLQSVNSVTQPMVSPTSLSSSSSSSSSSSFYDNLDRNRFLGRWSLIIDHWSLIIDQPNAKWIILKKQMHLWGSVCSITGASHMQLVVSYIKPLLSQHHCQNHFQNHFQNNCQSHWTPLAESIGRKVRLVFFLGFKTTISPTNAAAVVAKHKTHPSALVVMEYPAISRFWVELDTGKQLLSNISGGGSEVGLGVALLHCHRFQPLQSTYWYMNRGKEVDPTLF